jgi:hypothetical protein
MGEALSVKVTPRGVLVPRRLVEPWGDVMEVQIEQTVRALIITPKNHSGGPARDRLLERMLDAGLVETLPWILPPAVSDQTRAYLAARLGSGAPLSEAILEDREDRA